MILFAVLVGAICLAVGVYIGKNSNKTTKGVSNESNNRS